MESFDKSIHTSSQPFKFVKSLGVVYRQSDGFNMML